jgi:hypothetical protein
VAALAIFFRGTGLAVICRILQRVHGRSAKCVSAGRGMRTLADDRGCLQNCTVLLSALLRPRANTGSVGPSARYVMAHVTPTEGGPIKAVPSSSMSAQMSRVVNRRSLP